MSIDASGDYSVVRSRARVRKVESHAPSRRPEDATQFVTREAATVARFVQQGKLKPV